MTDRSYRSLFTRMPRRGASLALALFLILSTLGGWSAHAAGVAARPADDPTCPSPWTCQDIGSPTPAGSQTYDAASGTWQISGGGPSFAGAADQERFVSQPLTGDGSVSAQVLSQTGPQTGTIQPRAGVMWRQSSDPQSPFYALYVTPNPPNTNLQGEGIFIKYRATTGGLIKELRPWDGVMPLYLKITRSGTTFISYLSTDGVNWFFIPESAYVLGSFAGVENALVGMFVNSGGPTPNTQLNTATFNSVQVQPAASGTFADTLASTGSSNSYSFTPWLSGTVTVGSCAVASNGYDFDVSISNSMGTVLGSGMGQLSCNYATATVTAGQAYNVTTTAVSGSGKYVSAWSVNPGSGPTPVVWSLSNPTTTEPATITDTSEPYSITAPGGVQSVSFPTLTPSTAISLTTCSAPGTNFALTLQDKSGITLSPGTSTGNGNCQALTYTPSYAGLFRLVETSVSGTGVWTGTITTELPSMAPPPTATPTAVPPTNTPVPTTIASGSFAGSIAATGQSSSYSFMPTVGGPISVGACATARGYIFDVSLSDSTGTVLGSGTGAQTCNYLSATVSANQPYTVTTTAATGSGQYRSSWSVSATPVTWSLGGAGYVIPTAGGSQTFSFDTLTAGGGIAITACGPANASFALALQDVFNTTVATGTATGSPDCQALSYTAPTHGLYRLVETSISGTGLWTATIQTDLGATPPPTNTPAPPTNTPIPPTATTTVMPTSTNTPGGPTSTPMPSTNTPMPTNTVAPPTNTAVPPTATHTTVPTTGGGNPTAIPPANTPVPPAATNTPVSTSGAPTSTPVSSGCANTVPPLSVRSNLSRLYSGDMLKVSIATAALARGELLVQVTTTKIVVTGTGKHRKHVKETVVLYRVVRTIRANGQGQANSALRVTYLPGAAVRAALVVTARTACGNTARQGTLTITPLFTTQLPKNSVKGGGTLAVNVHSLARATVSLTLQVTTTRTVKSGGKHVKRIVVLYRVSEQGLAGKKGAFSGHLPVRFKPSKAVKATLTVSVHAGQHAAAQSLNVTVRP